MLHFRAVVLHRYVLHIQKHANENVSLSFIAYTPLFPLSNFATWLKSQAYVKNVFRVFFFFPSFFQIINNVRSIIFDLKNILTRPSIKIKFRPILKSKTRPVSDPTKNC